MEKSNVQKFTFEFDFAEAVKIIKGLQELPYKESANIIAYIQATYSEQQKNLELAAKKAAEKEPQTKKAKSSE